MYGKPSNMFMVESLEGCCDSMGGRIAVNHHALSECHVGSVHDHCKAGLSQMFSLVLTCPEPLPKSVCGLVIRNQRLIFRAAV